jgi:putative Holliday junction resolvase
VLALDLGAKRIGVAVSDPMGVLASPLEVVARSADRARDHQRIGQLVAQTGAERVVVGLPLSLDGSVGPSAAGVLEEVDELRAALDVPVETYDERLTTVTAERALRQRGLKAKARREVVDKAAAAVLLQAWLDGRSGAETQR